MTENAYPAALLRIALAGAVIGCGGGAPGAAQSPSPEPPYPPSGQSSAPGGSALDGSSDEAHIDDALAELDAAEAHVGQMLTEGQIEAMQPDDDLMVDRCESACRALSSMIHSADQVCRLAGDDDTRCFLARERVSSARTRVRETCGGCDDALGAPAA